MHYPLCYGEVVPILGSQGSRFRWVTGAICPPSSLIRSAFRAPFRRAKKINLTQCLRRWEMRFRLLRAEILSLHAPRIKPLGGSRIVP